MKILFLCDFFPPFVKGGAEISSFWQAKRLTQAGFKIIVLSPRYKDKKKIKKQNFPQYWFKLPIRSNKTTPWNFLNPFFVIYQLIYLIKVFKKEKFDIIHCQQKYSVPAAIIFKAIYKKPIIHTLRDYKGICNHAFCLWNSKKGCNLISFYKKDFLFYYQNYVKNKNIFNFLIQLFLSYVGRINTYILAFFVKRADKYISNSNYVKSIYAKNGYDEKKITAIYNFSPQINLSKNKLETVIINKIKKFRYIFFYAGKLTKGKGADIFNKAALKLIKKNPQVGFIFAGKKHFSIQKIIHPNLVYLGKISQPRLLKIMTKSDVVCIPSVWPEPISRVVLEAFLLKKPVLTTKVGGMPELNKTKGGWIVAPTEKSLFLGLKRALKDKQKWKNMGSYNSKLLKEIEKKSLKKLIDIYKSLV